MASSFSFSCSSKKPMRRVSLCFFLAMVVVAFFLLIDVADATFDSSTRQAIRDAKKAKKAAIKQARLDMKEARKKARSEKKAEKHGKKTASPTPLPEQFIVAGQPSVTTQPLFGDVGGPNNKKGFAKQMPVSVCRVWRWRYMFVYVCVCVTRAGDRHAQHQGRGERLNTKRLMRGAGI